MLRPVKTGRGAGSGHYNHTPTHDATNPMTAVAANMTLPNGSQMSDTPVYLDTGPLLGGFYSNVVEPHGIDALEIYYDIYHHDATCGTAINIMAKAPCRDGFFLEPGSSGLSDNELDVFNANVSALNLDRNLPRMLHDKLISGRCANSILVRQNAVIDLLTYSPERTQVMAMLGSNVEPVVKAGFGGRYFDNGWDSIPASMKAVYEEIYGEGILNRTDEAILRPQTMILLLNEMHSSTIGVSILRRVLPYWFYEKNMFRGTLQESMRRHRGIMQLILGDESWTPREEDYEVYTNVVQQAAADPHGAVIATRQGVSISEFMEGGSFWKWDDVVQATGPVKLRAMGFPESMLQGDSPVEFTNGMMGALDMLIGEREQVTRKVLREKALPLIAILNEYHQPTIPADVKALIKDTDEYEGTTAENSDTAGLEFFTRYRGDADRYLKMPVVHWHRKLAPPPDSTLFDLYDKMASYGLPIPVRMLATVGGLDLDDVISGAAKDVKDHSALKKISDDLKQFAPPPEDGGGFESGMSASGYTSERRRRGNRPASSMMALAAASAAALAPKPGTIVHDEAGNAFQIDHGGKPRLVMNEARMNDRVNGNLLQAAREVRSRC